MADYDEPQIWELCKREPSFARELARESALFLVSLACAVVPADASARIVASFNGQPTSAALAALRKSIPHDDDMADRWELLYSWVAASAFYYGDSASNAETLKWVFRQEWELADYLDTRNPALRLVADVFDWHCGQNAQRRHQRFAAVVASCDCFRGTFD